MIFLGVFMCSSIYVWFINVSSRNCCCQLSCLHFGDCCDPWNAWKQIAFKPKFLASRVEKEPRAVLSEQQMMNTIEYRVDCQVVFDCIRPPSCCILFSDVNFAVTWNNFFEAALFCFILLIHLCPDMPASSATAFGEYVRLSVSDWSRGANKEMGSWNDQSFPWALVFPSKCHSVYCWRHWQRQPHFGNDWGM